jgi:hypothetical protein
MNHPLHQAAHRSRDTSAPACIPQIAAGRRGLLRSHKAVAIMLERENWRGAWSHAPAQVLYFRWLYVTCAEAGRPGYSLLPWAV